LLLAKPTHNSIFPIRTGLLTKPKITKKLFPYSPKHLECFAAKQQFTTDIFIASGTKAVALASYLGFVNVKFEEMKNHIPSINNNTLSQANDVGLELNDILAHVNDVLSGLNDVDSGVNDVDSGLNDALSGVNDVHAGVNDVRSGVNDIRSEVNDALSGQNDDEEFLSYGCFVSNKYQYISNITKLLTN